MSGFNKHLDGKVKVIKIKPGLVHWKGRTVNLNTIRLKEARALIQSGFPYLELVPQSSSGNKSKKES